MFSKPALFPKAAEPQQARNTGLRPGSLSPSSASTLASSQGDAASAPREQPSSGVSSGASSAQSVAGKPEVDDDTAASGASRLIVGPDVKLKGAEILDCDTLVVEGRVEATMDSRVIRIAEQGSFSGTVGIDVAEVHGRFEGELTARSQLVIHSTGRVSGKIRYGKILIEEGGEISGDVQSLNSSKEKDKERGTESTARVISVAH
jgi:cytoskeletal protein CcmA (bactofilin family)